MSNNINQLIFTTGEKAPIDFESGLSVFLHNSDNVNIILKMSDIEDIEKEVFETGDITLGFQKYDNNLFNTDYDCYSFSFKIGEIFEDGIVFCNFNIAPEGFYLSKHIKEGFGYGFDIILIDEENVVKSIRMIGTSTEFSKTIFKEYNNSINNKFDKLKYEDSLISVAESIDMYENDEIVDKFTIAQFSQV